jgi:hypothetical protein
MMPAVLRCAVARKAPVASRRPLTAPGFATCRISPFAIHPEIERSAPPVRANKKTRE